METDRLVRKAGKTFTTWRPWLSIKPSANLAGLLALPCRIAKFSCVPPHNEEEKTVDPDELSTTNTKLLNNYFCSFTMFYHEKGWSCRKKMWCFTTETMDLYYMPCGWNMSNWLSLGAYRAYPAKKGRNWISCGTCHLLSPGNPPSVHGHHHHLNGCV